MRKPRKSKAAHRRGWTSWVGLLAVAVAGGVVGAVVAWAVGWTTSGPAGSCSAQTVADEVLPSVVTISVTTAHHQPGGTGSGEIINRDGDILTNNHVISSGVDGGSVKVTLSDGQNVTKGDKLTYDLKTGQAVVENGGGKSSRVHGQFTPNSNGVSPTSNGAEPAKSK